MDKIAVAKKVTKYVVGTSVGFTTKRIIANNTGVTEEDKRRHQAEAYLGGVVVGAMAAESAETFIDRKFDELVIKWQKIKTNLKNLSQ